MPGTMLILRGIAGTFGGKHYPHGALDEPAALAYAAHRGYRGEVLPVSGEAYDGAPQVRMALAALRTDPTVSAFLGFSGGGYNLHRIISDLTATERQRLKLVVVLGAPNTPSVAYAGSWELIYRTDPGHMDGPAALLGEFVAYEHNSDTATS